MMTKTALSTDDVNSWVKDGWEAIYSDTTCPGLQLRVWRRNIGSWSMRYKVKGISKRYTIGPAGDVPGAVSLKAARAKVHELKAKIAAGVDPIAQEQAEAAAKRAAELEATEEARKAEARITVAAALDRYIAYSTAASAKKGKGAPRERIRTVNFDVRPVLGEKKLEEITDDHVMKIVEAADEAGYERKPSKVYDEARAFLNWAVGKKLITSSPLKSPRPEQNGARERVLDACELRAFLTSLPMCPMTKGMQDVLELVLRLGQRVGEVAGMRHTEVNLNAEVWVIGGARAKNSQKHRVPLPPAARKIIIAAMERSKGKQWVFPNKEGDGPTDVPAAGKALLRAQEVFGFVDDDGAPHPFTSHDLRRSCSTCLEKLGTTERVIAAVLNHVWVKNRNVTGKVYAHADFFEEAFDALVRWEVALEQIMAGIDPFGVSVADRRKRHADIRQEMVAPLPAPGTV